MAMSWIDLVGDGPIFDLGVGGLCCQERNHANRKEPIDENLDPNHPRHLMANIMRYLLDFVGLHDYWKH